MRFLLIFLFGCSLFSYNTTEIQQILTKSLSGRSLFGDLFELKINGHPIRVQIKREQEPDSTNIIIAPVREEISQESMDNSCLFLNITQANKGHLLWLSTKDEQGKEQKCGLPAAISHKGSFLLSFVDHVALSLNLSAVTLTDASTVWCQKNKKFLSLPILNLLKDTPSWYQKNGYLSIEQIEYIASRALLINLPLSDVLEKLNRVDPVEISQLIKDYDKKITDKNFEESAFANSEAKKYWSSFAERLNILNRLAKDLSTTTFSAFAQTLYGDHGLSCDVYSEIIDLVFPPITEGKSSPIAKEFQNFFPWYKDYETFAQSGQKLFKNFKKHKRQESDQKE